MPGRHVHFDIPPTPPLVYSHSSSLSEGSPITPPQLNYFGSPHAYSPLPAVSSYIHPILSATNAARVRYNMSHPPNTTQLHQSYHPHALDEAATNPPLPMMTIICRHLPWSIKVTASNSKLGTYVTVRDVLNAIYNALRLGVTEREFESLPSVEDKRRVNDTFCQRYSRIVDRKASELERSKGVKRIDFLKGKHNLAGLTSTGHGPEVWELYVS